MQIRTILYQYIKTLIKHVFLLNFTYELLMSFRSKSKVLLVGCSDNIFEALFTNWNGYLCHL